MIRLHALVEGQTEERFFKDVIVPHLEKHDISAKVQTINSGTESSGLQGGGWNSYAKARRDLRRWRKEDPEAWFTTMVDLYAIPEDFPRLDEARQRPDAYAQVHHLEQAWKEAFVGEGFERFVPYIQLHEFEALILVAPQELSGVFLEHAEGVERLTTDIAGLEPELIDDKPDTAPSKRIITHVPPYRRRKAHAGPAVAAKIGLATLRDRCPHFHSWLSTLERLAPTP